MNFTTTVDVTHYSSKIGTVTYNGCQYHEESRWIFETA